MESLEEYLNYLELDEEVFWSDWWKSSNDFEYINDEYYDNKESSPLSI